MNDVICIILGMSGDLAKRKLIPALYKLVKNKKLEKFVVLGAARDAVSVDEIFERAREFIEGFDAEVFERLKAYTYYQQVDFAKPDDFKVLHAYAQTLEKKHALSGNRLLYVATASDFFCSITEYAARSKLLKKKTSKQKPWHRIVYEKPFGHDQNSAHAINTCIANYFDESQIYRVDHYLTKEVVSNIALVRFTNCVFEPLWNNRYIDNVQIILGETGGIEGRGSYYDRYGALRDMVQNHMLELVALIGMESPEKLTGEYVRHERAKVLEKITVVDAVLGQYEGYSQEAHVDSSSTTETFAALCLRIENRRWAGVPFYLKTGKRLGKKETVIHIKFKQVDCLLAQNCPSESNYLTIQVGPEAVFALSLNAKKPGTANEVIPVKMEFCHSCIFGMITPESYEVVFEEIIRGEQSISVRFDEIESAWRVIDTVRSLQLPVHTYAQVTSGPEELEQFNKKHGIRWRS